MAIHYYQEVINLSLSISDARIFSTALKKARAKKHLTQAECAELLERCRCSPSIENFYHICRTLDMSADSCIFPEDAHKTSSTYNELLLMLSKCDESSLKILSATAAALIKEKGSPLL